MNKKLVTGIVLSGALMAPLFAYSEDADSDRSSPKAFVKDSVITSKIKAEMAKTKGVSAMHIKVDTDTNGVVTLSGTAKSQDEVDKAVAIARGVRGVASVDNNIKVK